ncbi:MAG: hypothetical protein R3B69_01230 [Candidatus Paceibacterota bacterium]
MTIAGTTPTDQRLSSRCFFLRPTKVNAILAEETAEQFEALGITVVSGEARFIAPCAIAVAGTTYRYRRAVIATGSSPRLIEIPGLKAQDTLTNQNLLILIEYQNAP